MPAFPAGLPADTLLGSLDAAARAAKYRESFSSLRRTCEVTSVVCSPSARMRSDSLARGHGTLRFSYAASTADIEEGLVRLKRFMQARG